MIGFLDITEAVVKALEPSGYRVYDREVGAADLEGGPAVRVALTQSLEETVGRGRSERSIMLDIAYLEKGAVGYHSFYAFTERMNALLRPSLSFGGREVTLGKINAKLSDGAAHYSFSLEFTDTLDMAEAVREQMGELRLDATENKGGLTDGFTRDRHHI